MTTTQLGTPCTHCGLAVPPALLTSDGAASFCCSGCETAYGIVQQSGLGQYYAFRERRETAVQSSGHSFEEFDHPAFA